MKKVLLAIIISMFYVQSAFAVPSAIDIAKPCESVNGSTSAVVCTYEITNVAIGGPDTEFSLVTPYAYGNIITFKINNASTDFDLWFATSAGQTKATAILSKDIFLYYFTKDVSFSPDLRQPRDFVNNLSQKLIYFWMKNDDGANATGINYLSVVFDK